MRIRDLIAEILFRHLVRMRERVTGTDTGYFIMVSVKEPDGKAIDIGTMYISNNRTLAIVTPTGALITLTFNKA